MTQQTHTLDQALAIAVQHHQRGDLPKAAAIYNQLLRLAPNNSVLLHNLGEIACRTRKYAPAMELLQRAVALEPNNPNYLNTYSVALLSLGHTDQAYEICRRAISLNPNVSNVHSNLGICYADRGDLPASVASFERSIRLDPNNACAHDGLGLSLLMSGDLQRGWQEQEWRWNKYDFAPRRYTDARHWKGEDIAGKTLFLYVEQGFGDVVQFCRYVPLLAERGAKVLLETPPELVGLLKTLDGVAEFVPGAQKPPPFDFACPLMSVPLWFGTTLATIPAKVPYLSPDPRQREAWRPLFASDGGLKVGIAWAGRPTHANDKNRSTALANFAPLGDVPGVSLYSLQVGPQTAELANAPLGMRIVDLSSRLTSFDATAAVIAELDLVIAVDTVVIHLAGAFAKPVWSLLAFCPDWRWMMNRTDTPWYPTMRLFRLPRKGDWAAAFAQVKAALAKEVEGRTRR
ncbi:MAG: tetratricopeptide repeat protein [Tepidisphaeraceae bacterium]